jgi:hypothetical protein
MLCAIRISASLLAKVKKYVDRVGKLVFIEALIPTLAKKMEYDTPEELTTVVYRKDWKFEDVNKTNLFHPIKEASHHELLRDSIKKIKPRPMFSNLEMKSSGKHMICDLKNIKNTILTKDIDKVKEIFNEICAPNDIKDSVMLANISSMRYVQTSNVREDVSKLISQYDRYDAEMSNSQKQPLSQKKKFFAKLLAGVPLISHAIMQHQLHHFASTWDVFRSTVLRACQTVIEMKGSR